MRKEEEEELWRKAHLAAIGEQDARARGNLRKERRFQEQKEHCLWKIHWGRIHAAWLAEKAKWDAEDDETRAAMEAAYLERRRRNPVAVRGLFCVSVEIFDELERRFPTNSD